ncbi:dihydroxyacetone kinase subunit DhaK [Nakamurella leprariae]|uniref:Dihydroxyacetone kinase subunit DhaK n=1 Tax=Nakamurella leprariae TaxID=2803911 RepID=A0A939BYM1_9ACTN|nr:dihydroxyacetone kinase subunit DhaK [Nakamurella leprariae]MBM9467230.1 dihydroxyacetone kinase subunit DhaK [Nakamurella leprariae]
MKKIINDPADVVRESLEGLAVAFPDTLRVQLDPAVVSRADGPVTGKVALVSGGGSGHEPLHTGLVGLGMLDAAVPGPVFTSPTPDAVLAGVQAADGGAGVVLLVKNYTGDVLNFEVAAELAGAEGVPVRTVLIDDDVAVEDSTFTAGRRGIAGAVLVEKIAGAAAERGDGLDAVAEIATRVVRGVRSMGAALSGCTVPHSGEPSFTLAEDEIELGIGVHGEPGRRRMPLPPADALVAQLLDPVLDDLRAEAGDRVLLLVNGMGGTPLAELHLAARAAHGRLGERGLQVSRMLVGNYVTALEMQGMSLSVLRLDDEMLALWDAPVRTPALRWGA